MKATTLFAAGLFLVSVPAFGQNDRHGESKDSPSYAMLTSHGEAYMQKAVETYTELLQSDYDGIVESSIGHLAYIRIGLPDVDLDRAQARIAVLAKSGRTPVIRYKAYLATMVFANPQMFRNTTTTESTESDPFFRDIASKAQSVLLGQNAR